MGAELQAAHRWVKEILFPALPSFRGGATRSPDAPTSYAAWKKRHLFDESSEELSGDSNSTVGWPDTCAAELTVGTFEGLREFGVNRTSKAFFSGSSVLAGGKSRVLEMGSLEFYFGANVPE